MLRNVLETPYTPAATYLTADSHIADYGHFGHSLQTVAQIAKSSVSNPLRVATIDVGGGYDTHDNQGVLDWNGNARYPRLITNLANNIKAFCEDVYKRQMQSTSTASSMRLPAWPRRQARVYRRWRSTGSSNAPPSPR